MTPPVRAALIDGVITHRETTTAPRAAIWALWTDPQSWPRWEHELRSVKFPGPFEKGAKGSFKPTSGIGGDFIVRKVDDEIGYAITFQVPCGAILLERFFEDGAEDDTVFVQTVKFIGPSKNVFAAILTPYFRMSMPAAMERLKTRAEAQTARRAA
ncbi:MAG: SRPBCC family protein [Maricaulaceae bacterium]